MKKFLLAIACLMTAMTGFAQDALTVKNTVITAGEAGTLSVELTNPGAQYIACQFDLDVPAGVTINKGRSYALGTSYTVPSRAEGFLVGITEQGTNHYRVTMYNNDNYDFLEKSGEILVINITASADFKGGDGKIYEIVLTNADRQSYKPEAANFTIGETTGISSINAEENGGAVYNLAGQKVNNAQKGLFIKNGKKFVVK